MSVEPSVIATDSSDKYTLETITHKQTWVDGKLFSFRTTRYKGLRFKPGQFARLGIKKSNSEGGEAIAWRAYSVVSANYDEYLEFFSIVVPGGEFTSQLEHMEVGDTLYVDKTSYGFLTTDRFEGGKHLWMLSSGTGLAPFISMLWDLKNWEDYEHLIVVHSVRDANELAYRELIEGFRTNEYFREFFDNAPNKLIYIPVITRNAPSGVLSERITTLIENGRLEQAAGLPLTLQDSRILLCGNPQMVDDLRQVLGNRGFTTSRRAKPGQIAVENYW